MWQWRRERRRLRGGRPAATWRRQLDTRLGRSGLRLGSMSGAAPAAGGGAGRGGGGPAASWGGPRVTRLGRGGFPLAFPCPPGQARPPPPPPPVPAVGRRAKNALACGPHRRSHACACVFSNTTRVLNHPRSVCCAAAGYREKAGSSRTVIEPCPKGQVSSWDGSTRTPPTGTACKPCTGDNTYAPRGGAPFFTWLPFCACFKRQWLHIQLDDMCHQAPAPAGDPCSSGDLLCTGCAMRHAMRRPPQQNGRRTAEEGIIVCAGSLPPRWHPATLLTGWQVPAAPDDTPVAAGMTVCRACPAGTYPTDSDATAGNDRCTSCSTVSPISYRPAASSR